MRVTQEKIFRVARQKLGRKLFNLHFEHGQWWLEDAGTGAQWSVVECFSVERNEAYIDFEQVTEGKE
jgi:hypothetical protein